MSRGELRAAEPLAIFNAYNAASLQRLARQWEIDFKGKNKDILAALLTQQLGDAARIETALADLAPVERVALDHLILLGGETHTSVLRGILEGEGAVDVRARDRHGLVQRPRGSPSSRGSRVFEDVVARLGACGLMFTGNTSGYGGAADLNTPSQIVFIPDAVRRHLPPVTLEVESAPEPPLRRDADASVVARDVYTLLSAAHDEPLATIAGGQLAKRTLVRIDAQLRISENAAEARTEAELGRLPLLRTLAQDLDLLALGATGLVLGEGADRFLAAPRGERLRQLFDAYARTLHWSELSRLPIEISPRTRLVDPQITSARRRVLTELGELPAGEWIPLSHLVDRIRNRAYELLLPRGRASGGYYYYGYSYYVEPEPYGGQNPLGLTFGGPNSAGASWNTVEGAFVREIVIEPLWWLGVVDLGLSTEEEPIAFRVTPHGALLLAGTTPPLPESAPNVVVQPNFQVFAFEPTGEDILYGLDRLARKVRVEQVVEYQISRESIHAAQRSGMDVGDILAFLDRVCTTPLPQNVRRSIEDWGAQLNRVVVRRGTAMVHATDEATLDRLYADPNLARLLGRRIAPTAALVSARNLEAVRSHLTAGGEGDPLPLPATNEGSQLGTSPMLAVEPDGRILFHDRLPSIFLRYLIGRFTDDEPGGAARLSPASLRRGARAGYQAENIAAMLEQFGNAPLPEAVSDMVARWAVDWGRGALADIVLLQLESSEIMADALADRELAPYLRPIPGGPTLATVARDHLDRVRHLLIARGVDLQNDFPLP